MKLTKIKIFTLSGLLFVFVIGVICVKSNQAQQIKSKKERGTIEVRVRNTCGEALKDALIEVKGSAIKRKFKSNKLGYLVTSLPVGNYEITVIKYGFKRVNVISFAITSDSEFPVNVIMEEGYASDDPKAKPWKCPPLSAIENSSL